MQVNLVSTAFRRLPPKTPSNLLHLERRKSSSKPSGDDDDDDDGDGRPSSVTFSFFGLLHSDGSTEDNV